MSKLRVSIGPAAAPTGSISPLSVMVGYIREIASGDDQVITAPAVGTFSLPHNLVGEYEILDYSASTPIELSLTTEQGNRLLVSQDIMPSSPAETSGFFTVVRRITGQEVDSIIKATSPSEPSTTRTLHRNGKFVTLGGVLSNPRDYTFLVSAVNKAAIAPELLQSIFSLSEFSTTTKEMSNADRSAMSRLQLGRVNEVLVKLEGEFEFSIPVEGTESGWVWLLTNKTKTFIGIQEEKSLESTLKSVTIFLPFLDNEGETNTPLDDCKCENNRPIDATESELINNPEKFSDDPGAFCRPFINPNRIVGERSFFTVLRVTQPAIGGESSYPKPETLPPFPFSPTLTDAASTETAGVIRETTPSGITVITRTDADGVESVDSSPNRAATIPRSKSMSSLAEMVGIALDRANSPAVATKAAIIQRRPYIVAKSRGRHELNGTIPLEYESDSTMYQAQSLAFGHILEFRVRWRSNGYSLGNIAHSLTLAPRQTRKIVTVQSRILDQARRIETVQSKDSITQETSRAYSYQDAVESGLREWSKGGSKSSTTGAAGGFGFAMAGFVIGGGGSHGSSESSSWMNGGRNVAASEEQSLRDSVRQYGESLRKLESMVVLEQSQEELSQAVSEVIRNPNYCHSLTVVYHEILRHLRIDTEVVGARECIFVPLPILPFTVERALRWRDILQMHLLKGELRYAIQYLDEVATNFASSNIPSGPRHTQSIKYLTGSIYIQLAIERPKDNTDGTFNSDAWSPLARFLPRPPVNAFDILLRTPAQMDATFQKEFAPTIATRWVNTLRFEPDLISDFTLATKYNYNQPVRIDFTVSTQNSLTRSDLQKVVLVATQRLPPGSVANVKRMELHYFTDTFDYKVVSGSGTDDLISVATGEPGDEKAELFLPFTGWEKQDMQQEIRSAVSRLITHLNEHIEYYTKAILWTLDRDKLYMMLDSIYVRGSSDGRSVASVVEREPVGILGNSLVYRVASGAFLGIDGHKSPIDLNSYYTDSISRSEPIRISLPTSGLYAQSLMDECEACEEHFGSTEWVLNDKEPELVDITPEMLRSRRAEIAANLAPSQLPSPIINLQSPANIPSPSGFGDILNAIQNPNAFRDMAGLAGTQANAAAAMQTAANLASEFGSKALELRKAELAAKVAKEQLAVLDKAAKTGAINQTQREQKAQEIIENMKNSNTKPVSVEDLRNMAETAANNKANIEWGTALGESVKVDGLPEAKLEGGTSKLIDGIMSAIGGAGKRPTSVPARSNKQAGLIAVDIFKNSAAPGKWKLDKSNIVSRLRDLVNDPTLVQQGSMNFCGPAAFLYLWFKNDPAKAVAFAKSLFERGYGYVGTEKIRPADRLLNQDYAANVLPLMRDVCPEADWMMMVALRDDENILPTLDGTPDDSASAGTWPGELKDWLEFSQMYTNLENDTNKFFEKGLNHAKKLIPYQGTLNPNNLYTQNIVLLVNAHLLFEGLNNTGNPKSDEFILNAFPNHFCVLEDSGNPNDPAVKETTGGMVELRVWSWGAIQSISVSKETFENNYYGTITATTVYP